MTKLTLTPEELDLLARRRQRRRDRGDARTVTPRSTPQPWDMAWAMRRRAKMTIKRAMAVFRASHVSIHKWERGQGGWRPYVEWWRARAREKGFTF